MRRRSTRFFLVQFRDRTVRGDGQGGGRALTVDELRDALHLDAAIPTLVIGSFLHTDAAKAYSTLGPLALPSLGALQGITLWPNR